MSTWANAKAGEQIVAFRTTQSESDRLEHIRAAIGVRSKAQVLRYALDALELLMEVTDITPTARRETIDAMSILRVRLGVATPEEQQHVQALAEPLPPGVVADAERHVAGRQRHRTAPSSPSSASAPEGTLKDAP